MFNPHHHKPSIYRFLVVLAKPDYIATNGAEYITSNHLAMHPEDAVEEARKAAAYDLNRIETAGPSCPEDYEVVIVATGNCQIAQFPR